jgi:hypothetical protein
MNPNPNTTKGDCYKAAYNAVQELAAIGQSPTLVHGTIVPLSGPNADQTIRHAWVELEDACVCVEVSNGQQEPFGKPSYYSILKAQTIAKYTPAQAAKMVEDTGHYGRWD